MVNYKLIYFPGRGRAEPVRMLFAAANVKYEDQKVTQDVWPTLKPSTPFGSLPVLEIDGKMYAQSNAIAYYIAEEHGMLGKSSLDHLQIAQVCEACGDIWTALAKIHFCKEGDEIKNKMKEDAKAGVVLTIMKQLDHLAQDNGYFVGNSVTLADIVFYHIVDTLHRMMHGSSIRGKRDDRAKAFKNLQKVLNNVEDHPTLGKYINERWSQDAPF